MIGIASIAEIASLIGDPARANMLFALKDDGSVSAGDLSVAAGVAPSTATEHLAKLVQAGLVERSAKGRKRYYRLADSTVADVLEGVEGLAGLLSKRNPNPRWDQDNVHVRQCLDHLAGRLGGQIAGSAIAKGLVQYSSNGVELTDEGANWLASIGIDIDLLRSEPRKLIRLCPDWLEELPHIGGSVGAAMLGGMIKQGWLRRNPDSRTVSITPKGVVEFRNQLDLDLTAES